MLGMLFVVLGFVRENIRKYGIEGTISSYTFALWIISSYDVCYVYLS